MTGAFAAYPDVAAWQAAALKQPDDGQIPSSDSLPGFCESCGATTQFEIDPAARQPPVSLRETLTCRECGCNTRQRAAAAVLLHAIAARPRPRVYLTEHASPTFVALRRRLPRLRGSEFKSSWQHRMWLSIWLWRQGVPHWVRHADVTALRFRDASFDAIGSLDVLEHVPDYTAALREFARTLKPGGSLVLTVPFYHDRVESRVLATVRDDGSIEHLQPPEYHGDPLGGGVLCFHHFGWNLLDEMREAGFASAEAVRVQDPVRGWPQAVWLLHAMR